MKKSINSYQVTKENNLLRTEAIELWEKNFDGDHPDMEVIIEYAESQGYMVQSNILIGACENE
ncbi:hypothetical protein [Virgibacillus salexigens]|uniref:Uncharacterized protein n=1 Tax=Virgibacillus kapii TaxID=1638645 RepID=A0ABQ2DL29_9BACI|nr:hypothetical protein [Virgibacillus kapii]GGJ57330.1 hypothetical protein GCM10007111_19380 [Virgibacillus kapii]